MTVKIDGTNTVANPAFTGADKDTGLQCGTNELKLVTGGTARATVDSSGTVGIGITSPTLSNNSTGIHIHGSGSGGSRLHLTDSNTGTTKSDGTEIVVSGSDLYIDQKENASTIFYTNGSERARILSSGGITFNGDTAAANALDDYEEGTWTPVVNKAGVSGTAGNATSSYGYYRKVGNLLFLSFYWYKNSGGFGNNSGVWYISGIPFSLKTQANSAYQSISGGYFGFNGNDYFTDGSHRWQAHNPNGNQTLSVYGPQRTTNWSSGYMEISGSGVLMVL